MSYEKSAITDTPSAIPNQAPAIMREEAVLSPYGKSSRIADAMAKATANLGQQDKGGTLGAVESKPAEATVTLSPQVAALARKEQISRQKERVLKERESALEARAAKLAKLEAMEAKLANKDYSGLDELVDYNEYSQHQLNKLNGSDPNQEALKKLSDEVTSLRKSQEDNISKQFDAAVNERRIAINKLVETSPEFSSIKTLKLQEAVVTHLLDTWEQDSIELSVEDAAKEVKNEILERAQRMASVLEPQSAPADEKKQLPPLKQGLKTITNQVTAGEISKPAKSFQHMSDTERWAEARRRAEAKLQSRG